jgi:hypothetical protein
MAINNNPELIIREVLQQAKILNEDGRKLQAEKRLDIYKDNWKIHLKDEIDKQFSKKTRDKIKQMIDDSVNIPKRIVNDISLVYQKEANRNYVVGENEDKSDKTDERYQEIIQKIPTDIILQEVNRFTNLLNECLIYIVPRNNTIEYDILTPDQVEVFQDDENPTEPMAILFHQTKMDTVDDTEIRKVYWDVFGNHIVFNEDDQVLKKMENPYTDPNNKDRTILPFVIFHKNYPKDCIWDRTSGNDLFSAAIQVGVLLTYLNYALKTNSFKQMWGTGISKKNAPAEITMDQMHPVFDQNTESKFGLFDHQVDFEKIISTIIKKISLIANNWGLSLDNFKLTLSAESGFALRIRNFGLEKVVMEQKKFYRHYENQLFEKTKIVNNTAYPKSKIKEEGKFSVDFAEMVYPENPEENRKQWSFDLKLGAKNILQYIMEVNPDIKDDVTAEETLLENIRINREIEKKANINIDQILESLFKSSGSGGSAGGGQSPPLI